MRYYRKDEKNKTGGFRIAWKKVERREQNGGDTSERRYQDDTKVVEDLRTKRNNDECFVKDKS